MSSRWYPLYQKGNPQLRVFLPNFWMKLVKSPYEDHSKNRVMFHVSMGMSQMDVQNYLQNIYNVPVVSVRTFIKQGDFKKAPGKQYIVKEDDYKVAWITLPKDTKFDFPDIFPKEKTKKDEADEEKNLASMKEATQSFDNRRKYLPEVPGWFIR